MAAPNDFQVFISHGREAEKIQPRVVEVIEALNAVPGVRPRVDRYLDPDGALVKGIAFIDDGSLWRDRIDEAMYSVDAAIVCLDPISAASTWVRYEATIVCHRSRAEPGFRVFYLHDGELFRYSDEEPWSYWDTIRPQDRQLTKWSDLGNLIAEIRSVAANHVREAPEERARLLAWLTTGLETACESDRSLRGRLLEAVRDNGFPLADVISAERTGAVSDPNRLRSAWIVSVYVNTLIECRRRAWAFKEMEATVEVGASALDDRCAADTSHATKVFRDILTMLPTEAEIGVARKCFDPGPAPPPPARAAAQSRQCEPAPMMLDVSFADWEENATPLDVRVAIRGEIPKESSVHPSRPNHMEYLRDVLGLATGVVVSGSRRRARVPLFATGDDIDLFGIAPVDILRGAIDGSPLSDVSADDYQSSTGSSRNGHLKVCHVVVACSSVRVARRLHQALLRMPAIEKVRCPQCTVILDVSNATDRSEVGGFDSHNPDTSLIDWLVLDNDRVIARAMDQARIWSTNPGAETMSEMIDRC